MAKYNDDGKLMIDFNFNWKGFTVEGVLLGTKESQNQWFYEIDEWYIMVRNHQGEEHENTWLTNAVCGNDEAISKIESRIYEYAAQRE